MPKKHKDKPGWRDERAIPGNLGGGELVLFDGKLNPEIGGTARWVLHHFPSGRQASYPSIAKATDLLRSVRKKGFGGKWKVWGLTVNSDMEGGVAPEAAEVLGPEEKTAVAPPVGKDEILDELNTTFGAKFLCEKLGELLEATKIVQGQEVPDYRIQFQTVNLILNHRLGLPVQRQEIISHNVTTEDELRDRLRTSPHYRLALESILEEIREE